MAKSTDSKIKQRWWSKAVCRCNERISWRCRYISYKQKLYGRCKIYSWCYQSRSERWINRKILWWYFRFIHVNTEAFHCWTSSRIRQLTFNKRNIRQTEAIRAVVKKDIRSQYSDILFSFSCIFLCKIIISYLFYIF